MKNNSRAPAVQGRAVGSQHLKQLQRQLKEVKEMQLLMLIADGSDASDLNDLRMCVPSQLHRCTVCCRATRNTLLHAAGMPGGV